MQVGLMAPQGWKGEYDGWRPGRRLGPHDRARAAGRGARLRVAVGLRPLPHRPAADRRDHLRVVLRPVRAGDGDRARPARPHGHLHRVPQPRPHRQDGLDDRRHQRRPLRARHRRRLEGRGVAGLRLRLPDHRRADGRARRPPRDHPRDARRRAGRPYEGQYAHVRGAINVPKGIQQPRIPIIVGGNGERVTAGYAIRYADELNYVFLDAPRDRRADDRRCGPAARPRAAIRPRSGSRSTPATRTCASRARRGSTCWPGSPRSASTGSSASRPAGRRRPRRRRPSPRTAGRPA